MSYQQPAEPLGLMAVVRNSINVLFKWKWTASAFFLLMAGGVALYSFLAPPVFTAVGRVWIEEQPNVLPFEDVQSFDPSSYLSSQAALLKSPTLAAETIEKLKLYQNPIFAGELGRSKGAVQPSDPGFRGQLVEEFLECTTVLPVIGTRLVQVEFVSRDARFAADTLNALFDGFIDMIVRQRYRVSEQATEFLGAQIASVRADIETGEKNLSRMGSAQNILPLSATEAPTVTRLADLNRVLTEATIERIRKLDYYNQIRTAALGDIPDALTTPGIQRLREQYSTITREYAKGLVNLRPEYPEMRRLKSELDAARSELEKATESLVVAAYSDYQSSINKEQSLQRLLDAQKSETFKINNNSIIYNSLRIELENKKRLLESLVQRKSETDLTSRLSGNAVNVWIVDQAALPIHPTSPNKRKNLLIGLLFGLVGGVGLALFLEYLNDMVRTSRDVARLTGLPTLGSIPSFDREARPRGPKSEFQRLGDIIGGKGGLRQPAGARKKDSLRRSRPKAGSADIELIAAFEPRSIQAESYRSIRTTLLVSCPPGKIRTILFTSPLAREGKSATISNLGVILAEANKRVVIVDTDLRKPKQNKIFEQDNTEGLSRYLSSQATVSDILRPTPFPNLSLISSGPIPAYPIELLTSEKMSELIAYLNQNFDYVLFDTPPILAVSDALAMGPMVDAVIFICRGGHTPSPALRQAKQKIDQHKLKCLGVILNGVDLIAQDGYYARQYYHYSSPT